MTSKYKAVVAGCGGMSNVWIDYAMQRPDTEIVGLIDIQLEFAEKMREKKGLACGVFTDLSEAIEQTGANLVFDVTIPASHFQISSAAMKLGCNVFGEKPLAETMEDCNEIVRISERTGRTHAVMQNRRYDPRIRALRQMIASGQIGDVGFIGADFFIGAHFGGFRDAMDSPLLLDMAIHTFDQARLITGADPISVYCHEFNPKGSWYGGNASAICIFEMSDGSVFNYRGSWCAEGAPTSWEAQWRIVGDKGTAIWDGHGQPYAEVLAPGEQEGKFIRDCVRIEPEAGAYERMATGHHGCLDEMFLALEEGRLAETDCRDNRYSMAMVLAALESAKTGQKVMLESMLKLGK
ncbi:Gfo/Idh/MocA family protein [Cohnella thailandensis]|uniref:Gfo/Idh/MocA family oxidoreductase n=1 Tax=Cohnella thailandensis TaxID=557557 RepID=A0A841SWK9_9BACL|nr:Gfo/Idh/MocA family oxidoreductase [Cohnella thailandensis]MBB6634558.1 Gfo/Idh/MocA family oxidoreductase [Cohnella thailandensis]MBP1972887.1 putative dehydrogenase [Cohnella thailandensis]